MTFEEVSVELGLGATEEPFARGWEDSERSFPGLDLPFLGEAFIAESAALAALDADAVGELAAAAKRVRRNASLAHLLWHEHRLYCGIGGAPAERLRAHSRIRTRRAALRRSLEPAPSGRPRVPFLDEEHDPSGFPELVDTAVEGAPAMNLLLALSAVPHARSFYEHRRIPPDILRDTLSDIGLWVRYYRDRLGYTGINVGTLSWLRFHLRGSLFRLGRLQFMQGAFARDISVYRGAGSTDLRALAAGGLTVDASGLLLFGPEEAAAGAQVWTTRRRVDERAVYGNPVEPSGVIARGELALPLEEWAPVLQERTPILEIHVPEGEPMSRAACADSLERAPGFFREYFPERVFSGLTCESWFLGRELLDLLGPGSNMRSFADPLHLYPCLGTETDLIARIFGPVALQAPPALWERTTSLQRAVAARLEEGGRLRPGGGFLLADELSSGPWSYRAS